MSKKRSSGFRGCEENSPDFDDIVEQLTNGNGFDRVMIENETYADGQSAGSGFSGSVETSLTNSMAPVAPSVGDIDFQGLEIGSISVRITNFSSFYDPNDDKTKYNFNYEVFFEMPL